MSKTYVIVILDLSTNSTGYAVFSSKTKELLTYGALKPKVPGLHKLRYPQAAYAKIKDISNQIKDLIAEHNPDIIVVEEVNRGINRIAQKSLDALHFFVLDYLSLLSKELIDQVVYVDSNGREGWRGKLGLRLSDEDKRKNKEIRKLNKKNKLKYAPLDWKTLSCRYVKDVYGIELDPAKSGDNDIADAICIGHSYLMKG